MRNPVQSCRRASMRVIRQSLQSCLQSVSGRSLRLPLTEIFNNVSLTGQEILRIFADEDHNTQHTKNDENDTYNLRNTDRIPALLHRTDQWTATTERSGNLGRTVSKRKTATTGTTPWLQKGETSGGFLRLIPAPSSLKESRKRPALL